MSDHGEGTGSGDFRQITEDVLRPLGTISLPYVLGLLVTFAMICIGAGSLANQIFRGMGVTGLHHPPMWAVYITNFVFWVGIAHSGTLISAILFLFRAPFRAAFSRASEAMTLIAITTAGMFPLIHLGRIWRFYWLLPYPNERQLWVNFRSPLIADVFAVGTYFTVSALFFWFGLVPDVAIVRDRARGLRRTIYGLLSIGWEGDDRQWRHYLMAYVILASLATPLVISVHSVVSWDFALALVPGWHSTIFPPYFVAGAIFSGLAMVLTLAIPMRSWLRLQQYITVARLEALAWLIVLTSLIVSFSYVTEYFMTSYSGEAAEIVNLRFKAYSGEMGWLFWVMTICNSFAPLLLFVRKIRRDLRALFLISILINIGMWLERFVIIVGGLARDYIPYAWMRGPYHISWTEAGILIGSFGWFLFLFLIFTKVLPVLPIAELKFDELKDRREEHAIEAAEGGAR